MPSTNLWSNAPLAPDQTVTVIGDVHGMDGLLVQLLRLLPEDLGEMVFVGDLVDRGDNAAKVVAWVKELTEAGAHCIMGNHEKMLLDFLENPQESGPRFLRYGGLQTLMSYGVTGVTATSQGPVLEEVASALRSAMGDQVDWMANLPARLSFGNVEVLHAGADPNIPIEMQRDGTFIWGHPDFFKSPRRDDKWVVVGHTIMQQPYVNDGRIGIDTGSYASGNLSAVTLRPDGSYEIASTAGITAVTRNRPRSGSSR